MGIVAGVVSAFLVGAAARLAITGASRLAAGRFAIEAVLGLAVGAVLARTSQLDLTDADPGRARHRPVRGRRRSCSPARSSTHRPRGSPSASTAEPTTSPTRRLVLLTLAASAGPLTAVIQHLRDEPVDGLLLGGFTTAAAGPRRRAPRAGRALQPGAGRGGRSRCGTPPARSGHPRTPPPSVRWPSGAAHELLGPAAALRGVDRHQRARGRSTRPSSPVRAARWSEPTQASTAPCSRSTTSVSARCACSTAPARRS